MIEILLLVLLLIVKVNSSDNIIIGDTAVVPNIVHQVYDCLLYTSDAADE